MSTASKARAACTKFQAQNPTVKFIPKAPAPVSTRPFTYVAPRRKASTSSSCPLCRSMSCSVMSQVQYSISVVSTLQPAPPSGRGLLCVRLATAVHQLGCRLVLQVTGTQPRRQLSTNANTAMQESARGESRCWLSCMCQLAQGRRVWPSDCHVSLTRCQCCRALLDVRMDSANDQRVLAKGCQGCRHNGIALQLPTILQRVLNASAPFESSLPIADESCMQRKILHRHKSTHIQTRGASHRSFPKELQRIQRRSRPRI